MAIFNSYVKLPEGNLGILRLEIPKLLIQRPGGWSTHFGPGLVACWITHS